MEEEYLLDGKTYTASQLNEYAKQSNLSLNEYIYESGATVKKVNKYILDGKTYTDTQLKQYAKMSNIPLEEYIYESGAKPVLKKKVSSESVAPQKPTSELPLEDGSLVSQKSPNIKEFSGLSQKDIAKLKQSPEEKAKIESAIKSKVKIDKAKEKEAILKSANKNALATESVLEGAYKQEPVPQAIAPLLGPQPIVLADGKEILKQPTITEIVGVPSKEKIEQEYKRLDLDNPAPYLSASTYNRQPINNVDISKDTFIEETFTDEKLVNLGIDPADFDGYLNLSGFKEDYNKRRDRGDFESGTVKNPKLNEEIYKSKLLSNYIKTRNDREVLKSKLQSVKGSYEGKKIPVNKNAKAFDNNLIAKYTEENLPVLYKKLKDQEQINKEKYKELTQDNTGLNSFAVGTKGFFKSALNGFIDAVNKTSTTVYDVLGAEDLAEDLRYLNEERQLERPSERQVSFASGKVVNFGGKKYLVDEKGTVYDKDNEIVVNDLIEENTLNKILEDSKKSKEEDWFFSPQGTAVQTGSVLGDMVWQIAYQATIGRGTKGVGKLSIPKGTADAIIAQSSLGYAQAYQTTLKEAKDGGLTDKEAEEIASDAAQRTAIWYGMTAPISPQTKAVESLFGSAEKELIKKAVNAYKTNGKQGFVSTLNNGLKNIPKKAVGIIEEGGKEAIQENIQQRGESLWINAQKNIEAGREISDETMSFDDFVNTSILSFLSGGVASNLSMPSISANKKTQVKNLHQLSQDMDMLDANLNEMVNNNIISKEDADNVKKDAIAVSRNITRIPKDTSPEIQLDVMRKLNEIEDLENSKQTLDKSFHAQIDEKIQEKRNEVKEIYDISLTKPIETDAIQEQTTELPDEIANLNDNELITFTVKTLDEVPEQFRDKAKKIGGQDVETRKLILGLPLGKKETVKTPEAYVYLLTGKEAKDYAIQEQTTDESVLRTEQPEVGLQEMGQGDAQGEVVTEQGTQEVTPSETIITAQEVVGIPDEVSQPIELSLPKTAESKTPVAYEISLEGIKEENGILKGNLKELIFVNPEKLTPLNDDEEMIAWQSKEDSKKENNWTDKEWAESVLDVPTTEDPIDATLKPNGKVIVTDGHHRLLASKILGKDLAVNLKVESYKNEKGNPTLSEYLKQVSSKVKPINTEVETATETTTETAPVESLKDVNNTTNALEISPFGKIKSARLFKLSGVKMPTKTDDFIRDAKDRTTNTEDGVNFSNILLPDGNTIFDKLMNIGVRDIELTNLFELFRRTIGRNSIDRTEQFKKDIFDFETEGTSSEDIAEIMETLSLSNEVSKIKQSQKNIEIAKEFKDTFEEMAKEGVLDKDLKPLVDEIADSFENNKLINVDSLSDLVSPNQDYNWANKISEAYHKAKVEGSNPELVKAVEELLAPEIKAEVAPVVEETPKEFKKSDDKFSKEDLIETLNSLGGRVIDEGEAIGYNPKGSNLYYWFKEQYNGDWNRVSYTWSNSKGKMKSGLRGLDLEIKVREAKKSKPIETKVETAPEVKAEVTPVEEVKGKLDELLELDPADKTTLGKISSELGDMINEFKRIEKDLGSNILLVPMRYVLQGIKALVDGGMTLQEAIKKVAADQNFKVRDVIKGINDINEIAKISTAYGAIMEKADKLIARQKAKGIAEKKIISNLDTMIRKSPIYTDPNTTDAQRKIMEREARAKIGMAPKKAVSIGRVIGALNDITNVSRAEKLKIISRIRELSKDAVKDLVEDIRELAKVGKITPTQSVNIISRFGKVNMLNEVSVSNFVDYMTKVFADAEYDNKINVAKGKLKAAKKNIATKIGVADGLAFPLQTLFSINPSLIPIKNLERYMELVEMFSARKAVLQLDEISKVTNDVNDILDEINNEQSLAQELAYRLENSKNQVLKDGKLDYAATVKNMVKEGDITQEEADLMVKYKKDIVPQVEKSEATDEEIEAERKELESEVKKSTINSDDLPTRDERIVAKKIAEYLKKPFINQLSNADLKNLLKAIDNINNGYLPHQAELILEKLNGLSKSKTQVDVIEKANLKKIAQLVNTVYNTIKSKMTDRDAIFEMIRRTPLFNIDQILGNFKTEELYYSLLGDTAKAEAKFSFELKTIQEKLQKAQNKVAKSFLLNPLKSKISSYKIKTYLIQLEYNTNPGDERVNPAAEYIKATVKHINKLKSQYNENDVKILEDILKNFAPDGQIDIDKLYNSFNSAEKEAIKTIQEIRKFESEKAEFTAAVIRGKRINPLNNYTHISVLSEDSKEDLDEGISFAKDYNNSLRPSTKAKNLMERTPGAKPINFNAYSTALKSSKYVLLDYYLTAPVRTARKSMNATEVALEKDGGISKEQRRIFNAVNDAFELALSDLVDNSYVQTSFGQDIINSISKQGYRAVLAGLGKSGIELLSNLGYVAFDPFTFYKGVENMGVVLSEDLPAIMNNSKSIQTNRVNASGLSGRMIDLGILDQSVGTKSSKTRGKIINKAQQVWNLTAKKFIKNPVELTADTLISSPDKVIMKPYWLGSYITELEKQLGRKVTKQDLKKIAENNEEYMNENEVAIENATRVADRKSKLMGATKNGFSGLLRGKTREGDKGIVVFLKNANAYMTNFMVYEYNAAKTGVMAAIGDGTMTRAEGAGVLAGVITRMTVYNLLIKSTTSAVAGLFGFAFGLDDEEEEEKAVEQLVTQSLLSTFASLTLGRDFGNISKTVVNYGFEEYVTKEYLEGLRTGEYDPYEDAILINSLQRDEKTGEMETWENIPNFMGSYGPIAKTGALAVKVISTKDKKKADAIERQEKERNIRLPLEILGNAGYIPLYKEIRKSVMDDIYKDLKSSGNRRVMTREEYDRLTK